MMAQGRYGLTHLEIAGLDVSLTAGKITRGTGPVLWDVTAEGVSQDTFDGLVETFAAHAKETELKFTDDQGSSHHSRCHLWKRTQADPGLHLDEGTLTFSFEGPIK
jgi:hypothetical protein